MKWILFSIIMSSNKKSGNTLDVTEPWEKATYIY